MLQRILDWIDEAAGGLIRITYLLAGITAVSAYFGAGELPTDVQSALNFALPWLLAFSVETHTYLTARRVAKSWHLLQSPVLEAITKKAAKRELQVNLVILALLVAFSIWNQLNYLLGTWHPATNSVIALPDWVAYGIRASAAPLFFMAAAFLARQAESLGESITGESHRTLRQFLRVLRRQRKAMLAKLKGKTIDMGDAIDAVSQAAGERKAGATIAVVQRAITHLAEGASVDQAMPRTVPVSTPASKPGSAEDKCRRVWRNGMTVKQLQHAAKVSESTAKRWRARFLDQETLIGVAPKRR